MLIRVYYEDTDAGGIVYHSNYLNFCERARSEIFFQKGFNPILENSHFVAKNIVANFTASARLGDMLSIETELIKMKAASLVLNQTVYNEDTKVFEMQITLAHISFDNKVKKMDAATKELLQKLFVGS